MDTSHQPSLSLYLDLIERERNIYEPAKLFQQQRRPVKEYVNTLRTPDDSLEPLKLEEACLNSEKRARQYPIQDEIVDFRPTDGKKGKWDQLNEQFLNYHRSLTTYTMVNSAPIINYLSLKTGLGELKNARVLDVGGGTGHTYCSFFRHPQIIEYYLLDPNLRLLHDQFIRFYPQLSYLPMVHLLGYAEHLPFINEHFDLVISISSIDHFKDYEAYIREAHRVLKPGGILLISSHLDIDMEAEKKVGLGEKLFSSTFLERLSRYLYFRKFRVGSDDHTYHFTTIEPMEKAIKEKGFTITGSEVFSRHFFILGKKS